MQLLPGSCIVDEFNLQCNVIYLKVKVLFSWDQNKWTPIFPCSSSRLKQKTFMLTLYLSLQKLSIPTHPIHLGGSWWQTESSNLLYSMDIYFNTFTVPASFTFPLLQFELWLLLKSTHNNINESVGQQKKVEVVTVQKFGPIPITLLSSLI